MKSKIGNDMRHQKPRQVAVVWSMEDVKSIIPKLNHKQAFSVLQRAVKSHDANGGITWDVIETIANELFPDLNSTEN